MLNKKELIVDDLKTYSMMESSTLIKYHEIELSPYQLKFSWPATEFHMRVLFSLCLDKVTHKRFTYSLIQMLADIGGLLAFLFSLCSLVIKGFM